MTRVCGSLCFCFGLVFVIVTTLNISVETKSSVMIRIICVKYNVLYDLALLTSPISSDFLLSIRKDSLFLTVVVPTSVERGKSCTLKT